VTLTEMGASSAPSIRIGDERQSDEPSDSSEGPREAHEGKGDWEGYFQFSGSTSPFNYPGWRDFDGLGDSAATGEKRPVPGNREWPAKRAERPTSRPSLSQIGQVKDLPTSAHQMSASRSSSTSRRILNSRSDRSPAA
jgi:hypothetical protein